MKRKSNPSNYVLLLLILTSCSSEVAVNGIGAGQNSGGANGIHHPVDFSASRLSDTSGGTTISGIELSIQNPAAEAQDTIVALSVPFPANNTLNPAELAIAHATTGEVFATHWQDIERWTPGGAIKVAIARFRIALPANTSAPLVIRQGVSSSDAVGAPNACVAQRLGLQSSPQLLANLLEATVRDINNVSYTFSTAVLSAYRNSRMVQSTPFFQVYRVDGYFISNAVSAINRPQKDFLKASAYIKIPSERSQPIVEVYFQLANNYTGWGTPIAASGRRQYGDPALGTLPPFDADAQNPRWSPLGPVVVNGFEIAVIGADASTLLFDQENGLNLQTAAGRTIYRYDNRFTMADFQGLMFHLKAGFDCGGSADQRTRLQRQVASAVDQPLVGLASAQTYAATGALSLDGSFEMQQVPGNALSSGSAICNQLTDTVGSDIGSPFAHFGQGYTPNGGGGFPLLSASTVPAILLAATQNPCFYNLNLQWAMNHIKWPEQVDRLYEIVEQTHTFWAMGIHFEARNQLGRPRHTDPDRELWNTGSAYPSYAGSWQDRNNYTGNDSQHWSLNALATGYRFQGEPWMADMLRDNAAILLLALPNRSAYTPFPEPGEYHVNEREVGVSLSAAAEAIALGLDSDNKIRDWASERIRLLAIALDHDLTMNASPLVVTNELLVNDNSYGYNLPRYHVSTTWQLSILLMGATAIYRQGVEQALDALIKPTIFSLVQGYEHNYTTPAGNFVADGMRYATVTHTPDSSSSMVRRSPRFGDTYHRSNTHFSLSSTAQLGINGTTAANKLFAPETFEYKATQCIGSVLLDRMRSEGDLIDGNTRVRVVGSGFTYGKDHCQAIVDERERLFRDAGVP